jgi:hypothetical protein
MDEPQATALTSNTPENNDATTDTSLTSQIPGSTMGTPLNTSMIQNADSFTIVGGQFNSAAGNVTVHHYYTHVSKDALIFSHCPRRFKYLLARPRTH